ncbi:MAG: hypothetical protein ACE368_03660 [Paracoccaceae bacterium]
MARAIARAARSGLGTGGLAGHATSLSLPSSLIDAQPDFTEDYVRATYPFARPEDLELFVEGLRRAGALDSRGGGPPAA